LDLEAPFGEHSRILRISETRRKPDQARAAAAADIDEVRGRVPRSASVHF
jgi:hypothetical protein